MEVVSRDGAPSTLASDGLINVLNRYSSDDELLEQLSPSEKCVLGFMAEGLSNDAIAVRMGLSSRTVESHFRSILSELVGTPEESVNRRVCAVLVYVRARHTLMLD